MQRTLSVSLVFILIFAVSGAVSFTLFQFRVDQVINVCKRKCDEAMAKKREKNKAGKAHTEIRRPRTSRMSEKRACMAAN